MRAHQQNVDPRPTRRLRADQGPETIEPCRTRGVRVDYRYLNNPFTDEEEAGISIVREQAFTVVPKDDCHSLREACDSPDWPEWEAAIHSELDQLR